MAHYVSASRDDADGLFLPPQRTLGFNPQLTMNDSLLVQSYIEAYDISYPEALRRIEDEVDELRQHLDSEGRYELNDIGVLCMNDEGHLEFKPCEAGILTPSLYGLSSFEMAALDAKPARVEAVYEDDTATAAASQQTLDGSDDTPAPDDTADGTPTGRKPQSNDHDQAIVIKMSWLRNAAAIAAAVVAFFMIQTPVSNSRLQSEVQHSSVVSITAGRHATPKPIDDEAKTHVSATDQGQQPVPEHEAAVAEEHEAAEAERQKTSAAEEQENIAAEEAATTPAGKAETTAAEEAETAPAYCIVLASETTRRLAKDYLRILHNDGHDDARIVDMRRSSRVRVVYGSYATHEEAHKALRQLRKQEQFKDAWVLKQ